MRVKKNFTISGHLTLKITILSTEKIFLNYLNKLKIWYRLGKIISNQNYYLQKLDQNLPN